MKLLISNYLETENKANQMINKDTINLIERNESQ